MKGSPMHYDPNQKPGMFQSWLPIITILVMAFCFYSFMWFIYASMYNDSITRCLQTHSQDVCLDTLK